MAARNASFAQCNGAVPIRWWPRAALASEGRLRPRPYRPRSGRRRGFTLVEGLVSILIMGLAVGGLLSLLQWGWVRYTAVEEQAELQAWITTFRVHLRRVTAAGDIPTAEQMRGWMANRPGRLQAARFTVDRQGALLFIRPDLFVDRNRNLQVEANERVLSPVFCFRVRGAQP